jgi:hypothetical protein
VSEILGMPTAPLLDPATGDVADVWRQFFVLVFRRLSGSQIRAPVVLTPTASPFSYTAPWDGTLFASGGGIESMMLKRGAGTPYPVGGFYGATPLRAADQVTIRYVAAPTLVFFPG